MIFSLRPYQSSGVADLRQAYAQKFRAPLYVLPTAGGKTVIFSYISDSAFQQGKKVGILVHRHELLMQTSKALDKFGVPHGLISPKFTTSNNLVQVASVQTLIRKIKKGEVFDFDLLICDEAHHLTASTTWGQIAAAIPGARILGVTATPCRLDGRGLGKEAGGFFDVMILGPSMKELIAMGYLSKYDLYIPPTNLDLTGVKKKMGDYEKKELANRVDKPKVTGSAVAHYTKICPGAPTIAFCVSVDHAMHVAEEFRAAGYRFECIHGKLTDKDRKRMIDGLENGSLHGLTSADLISEGTDVPCVTTVIMLRPTHSLGLWLQQIGRGLRTHPSKEKTIILDHVAGTLIHGLPDEDREWSLDGVTKRKKKKDEEEIKAARCDQCYGAYSPHEPICPYCGHEPEAAGGAAGSRKIAHEDGELKKVTEEDKAKIAARKKQRIRNAKSREELLDVAKEYGYKSNWVFHVMKAREQRKGRG